MNRRLLYRGAVVVAALAPLTLGAGCGGSVKGESTSSAPAVSAAASGSSEAAATGDDLLLGASLSMTGPLGDFGRDLQIGYQHRLDEINAAGGLKVGGTTRKLTMKVLDNRSDPNIGSQQIRELVLKDKAVALLGACTPAIIVPQAQVADQQKVPYTSSCNPVRAFQAGNTSGWKYAWDISFDEADQATGVAKLLAETGSTTNKKVVLFEDTDPDGVAQRPLNLAAMKAAGLDVVGDYSFPVGTTDFSSFINDAKSKGAQLLYAVMIPPDGIALWKQMKSLSFSPPVAFAAKASAALSWTKALGPLAEGTLGGAFWSPAAGKANSQDLHTALSLKFPNNLGDEQIAVLGYTVAAIVTDAIKSASSTDADALNTAIGHTSGDYPLGTVKFDATTHTSTTPFLAVQWQNGQQVQILPADPSVKTQFPAKGLQP